TFTNITSDTTFDIHFTGPGGAIDCHDSVVVPPPPITIRATKVICDNEADLPNYGGGGPDITTITATDWVSTHSHCHLAPNWTFEWANGGQSNPGDNVAIGGTGWTPFGPTSANGVASTSVNSFTGGKIWVREQVQDGYIPFTGANGSNVSAEMYCHTDVNKYDNYDFINNPQAGLIYNCVAWNVPTPPPPPGNGCIQVLKETFNQDGNKITPVAQFTFTLDGGPTVHNDANGNAIFNNVTPGTHQVVEASAGPTWNLLSVTPASGNVNVQSGPICSAVVFKNKQVITTN